MGFLNALKGANVNFGTVDSPDFPACYLTWKGKDVTPSSVFLITGAQNGDYEFTREDIKEFRCVCAGATWVKYKIVFNDGKSGIITSHVDDPDAEKKTVTIAPIERFFGDLL